MRGLGTKLVFILIGAIVGLIMLGAAAGFIESASVLQKDYAHTAEENTETQEVVTIPETILDVLSVTINGAAATEQSGDPVPVEYVAVCDKNSGVVKGINTTTHAVAWTNSDYSDVCMDMDYYDGVLYVAYDNLTTGYVNFIDPTTGLSTNVETFSHRVSEIGILTNGRMALSDFQGTDDIFYYDMAGDYSATEFTISKSTIGQGYVNTAHDAFCFFDTTADDLLCISGTTSEPSENYFIIDFSTIVATYGNPTYFDVNTTTKTLYIWFDDENGVYTYSSNNQGTVQTPSEVWFVTNKTTPQDFKYGFLNGTELYSAVTYGSTGQDITDGSFSWENESQWLTGDINNGTMVDRITDGSIVYVGGDTGYINAVDSSDGSNDWNLEVFPSGYVGGVEVYDDDESAPYDYEVSGSVVTFQAASTDVDDAIVIDYTIDASNPLFPIIPIVMAVALISGMAYVIIKQ